MSACASWYPPPRLSLVPPPAPDLVARAVAGDRKAFDVIVRRELPRMLRTARSKLLQNTADAEDAVQDALLRAHRAIGSFRAGTCSITTWLHGILVNVCIDRIRRAGAPCRSGGVSLEDSHHAVPGKDATPVESFDAAALAADLDEEIAKLPRAQREAVRSYYFTAEGRTYENGTFGARLRYAKDKLREPMVRRGYGW